MGGFVGLFHLLLFVHCKQLWSYWDGRICVCLMADEIFCCHFLAVLFLLFYERDFMTSLSDDNQADSVEVFSPTSKYLDALLILTILISKILVINFFHLNCINFV